MTAPPDGLRAHQGQAAVTAEFHQPAERLPKLFAERVVRVVVEAAHPPEGVQALIDAGLSRAASAERRHVPITDLMIGQRLRDRKRVVEGKGGEGREALGWRRRM